MNLNKFNVGIFAFNASSGTTITKHPKAWKAEISKILSLARDADKTGFDFLLPIARWSDWGGDTRTHKNTFETLTLISALATITKKIFLFSTIHSNYIHPIVAAKAISTLSEISNKRIGINFVCGWNKEEYEMFNLKEDLAASERYKIGLEWLKIFNKLISSKVDKFNFKGKFFNLKNAQCYPKSIEKKKFLKISAAFSDSGRKFAVKNFEALLTMFNSFESLKRSNLDIKKKSNIKIINPVHVIIKNSNTEAEDFYEEYTGKLQDTKGVKNFIKNLEWSNKKVLASFLKQIQQRVSGSLGSYTIKGDKKRVLEEMNEIYKAKSDGVALTFFDYEKDYQKFRNEVFHKIKKF